MNAYLTTAETAEANELRDQLTISEVSRKALEKYPHNLSKAQSDAWGWCLDNRAGGLWPRIAEAIVDGYYEWNLS